jgi:hypothetical protein
MTHLRTVANARFVRERPTTREIILREKWIPDVLISREKMYWDGYTARRPDGRRVILPESIAEQMILLAKAGAWGDLSCVFLDFNQHAMIREQLDRKSPRSISELKQWEPTKASGASA